MPAPSILLTGFEAFGEHRQLQLNPSAMAALQLHGQLIADHTVIAQRLPTVFGQASEQLIELVRRHRPALVLCVGQAGGRAAIELERVAVNVDDAPVADNEGQQPIDQPVVPGAPAAYFSTLPIKACVRALSQAGLPARVSGTAGTFVCNHVFYALMHELACRPTGGRGGFVHLPWLSEQGEPSLALSDMVRGLSLIAQTCLQERRDVALSGGQIA